MLQNLNFVPFVYGVTKETMQPNPSLAKEKSHCEKGNWEDHIFGNADLCECCYFLSILDKFWTHVRDGGAASQACEHVPRSSRNCLFRTGALPPCFLNHWLVSQFAELEPYGFFLMWHDVSQYILPKEDAYLIGQRGFSACRRWYGSGG